MDLNRSILLMVTMFGATAGTLTVLRPILLAELFGTKGFATKNGEVQLTAADNASTPVLAGLAVGAAGYANPWLGLALITGLAAIITCRIDHQSTETKPPNTNLARSPARCDTNTPRQGAREQ